MGMFLFIPLTYVHVLFAMSCNFFFSFDSPPFAACVFLMMNIFFSISTSFLSVVFPLLFDRFFPTTPQIPRERYAAVQHYEICQTGAGGTGCHQAGEDSRRIKPDCDVD